MIFLTETDFNEHIGADILSQITGDDDTLLDKAELIAIGTVKDAVSGLYDVDTDLEEDVADNRHQPLVLWLLSLATYQLYRQIPDDEVPARVIKDYDDTMETLIQIGRGKHPTNLSPIEDTDGSSKRVFRMGSSTARSHDML